jgi:hypothetical protein
MPYPMSQMPTLDEFLEKTQGYGIERETRSISSSSGRQGQIDYLRQGNGVPVIIPSDLQGGRRLTLIVLRGWCRHFDIDPATFGLTLD